MRQQRIMLQQQQFAQVRNKWKQQKTPLLLLLLLRLQLWLQHCLQCGC